MVHLSLISELLIYNAVVPRLIPPLSFTYLLHRALIGSLFRGLATRSGFTKQTDHPPAKTFELAVLSGKIQLFKFHHVFKDSAAAFH